jgi:ABC-type branched-subunit amino acid transport system permease subunit
MMVAAAAAGLVGLLIGVPALRLSGPYLAVATVGLAVVFTPIAKLTELEKWTGGVQGLALFRLKFGPPVDWTWLTIERWYYFVSVLTLGVGTLLLYNLLNSASGRSFRAVRDSEVAAAAMGINVSRAKLTAFMTSAAYAGVAGGLLFLVANRFVSPDSFTLAISIEFITAVAIGGRASLTGSLLGGFFLIYIYREGIETVSKQTEAGSNRWLIMVGILIALGVLFGNRRVREFTAELRQRSTLPVIGSLVNLGRLVVAVAGGLLLAVVFRLLTDDLLDVTLLRGAISGSALILIILFLPGGLAGLIPNAQALRWRRVGRALRAMAGLRPAT